MSTQVLARAVLTLLALLVVPRLSAAQGALTNGAVHTGAINPVGDVDTWTFTANQGDHISVRIGEIPVGPGVPDPGFYPYIRLIGTTGTQIDQATGNVDAEVALRAPLSGTYQVHVSAYYAGGVGNYRINLATAPGAFQTSGGDEGGPMTNGLHHTGHIDVGDIDMWSFHADQNDTVVVRIGEIPVQAGQPDPGFYPFIRIVGTQGVIVRQGTGDLDAEAPFTAPLSGTYTVLVSAYYPGGHGDYRLNLAKAPGSFQTAQTDQGGPLTNGLRHDGRIVLGDIDIWSFDADKDDTIAVRIGEVPVGPGTPDPGFYPFIRVVGPLGDIVRQATGDVDAEAAFRAALTGTYTVIVTAYYAGGTGDYRVGLAMAPAPFQTAAGDHGGPIANGLRYTGRTDLGDLDMYSFTAAQGHTVAVRIGEIPVGPGTPDPGYYPFIRVVSPAGVLVDQATGDTDAETSFNAPLSGTYTVFVSAYYAGGTGDYRISYATAGAFQTSPGDQGGPLANGVAQTADIDLGDIDMWSFSACQGTSVTVTMAEIPVGPGVPDPGFYPFARVIGPAGTVVGQATHALTATVTFTAPATGAYTVVGTSYYAGIKGDYTMQVNGACTPPPPPPLSVDDGYATAQNTPLVVPPAGVLINDANVTGATAAVVSGVSVGSLSFLANGGFTYTPPNGFSGQTSFTYRATNAAGPGNVATVTITVQAGPQPPQAVDDTATAVQDQTLVVDAPGVMGNDVAGAGGPISALLVSPTSNGGVTLNSDGSFNYTPNPGYTGADAFTYRVSNANGFSNVATVTITVTPSPTANPSNLFAWSIVDNIVTLRWTAPTSGTPTNYFMDGGIAPGAPLVSIATNQTEPVFVFAAPSGSFYVQVRAIVNGQSTAPTNEIRIDVNVPVAPSAPTGLTGMVNVNAVALSWRNTFAGGPSQNVMLDVSGPVSGSVPLGSAESFTFNGIPDGTYTFSVRAQNAGGTSPSSNAVTLTFPQACTGAPQSPEQFLAFNTGNLLTVIWGPPTSGNAPTHFMLNVSGSVNASVPFTTRGISVPVPPGSYTFSVAAVNACGSSAPTAPDTVTIP
jgi:hypothetical protein